MSEIKDGGWAFPSHGSMGEVTWEGMTLRDYFAAKALPRFIAHDRNRKAVSDPEEAAQRAYEYADAMLRARSA
jgi:hypothetical protein